MEKDQVKEIFSMWKQTNRLNFIAGMVASSMILGLSFVRPHLEEMLGVTIIPGLLYAFFYVYKINKVSKSLNQIKESIVTHAKRTEEPQ